MEKRAAVKALVIVFYGKLAFVTSWPVSWCICLSGTVDIAKRDHIGSSHDW